MGMLLEWLYVAAGVAEFCSCWKHSACTAIRSLWGTGGRYVAGGTYTLSSGQAQQSRFQVTRGARL